MHCTKLTSFVIFAVYFLARDQVVAVSKDIQKCVTDVFNCQNKICAEMEKECDLILLHFRDPMKRNEHMRSLKALAGGHFIVLEKEDINVITSSKFTEAQIKAVKKSIQAFEASINAGPRVNPKFASRIKRAIENYDEFGTYLRDNRNGMANIMWESIAESYIDTGLISLRASTLEEIKKELIDDDGLSAKSVQLLKSEVAKIRMAVAEKLGRN